MPQTDADSRADPLRVSGFRCPQQTIEDLKAVLSDEYGATAEPSPDDELHSRIVWPNIVLLRRAIYFLQNLALLAASTVVWDRLLYKGLKMGAIPISELSGWLHPGFLWG